MFLNSLNTWVSNPSRKRNCCGNIFTKSQPGVVSDQSDCPPAMTTQSFYLGQRLSYAKSICTVRYIGEVNGTKGEWLGVEWDVPSKGKHAGGHGGKVYFKCASSLPPESSTEEFHCLNKSVRSEPKSHRWLLYPSISAL